MSSWHTDGLTTGKISEEKVGEGTPGVGSGRVTAAPVGCNLRGVGVVEGKDSSCVCICARLDCAQICDLRTEFNLMTSVKPVKSIVNLIDVVEITDQTGRCPESGEARDVNARNAIRILGAGDV